MSNNWSLDALLEGIDPIGYPTRVYLRAYRILQKSGRLEPVDEKEYRSAVRTAMASLPQMERGGEPLPCLSTRERLRELQRIVNEEVFDDDPFA